MDHKNISREFFSCLKKRKLSLFGKAVIINSLGIAKCVYNFTLLDVPDSIIQKINKIIFSFLWKKESVARNNLIRKGKYGGINLVDVKSKISALKNIMDSSVIDRKYIMEVHTSL